MDVSRPSSNRAYIRDHNITLPYSPYESCLEINRLKLAPWSEPPTRDLLVKYSTIMGGISLIVNVFAVFMAIRMRAIFPQKEMQFVVIYAQVRPCFLGTEVKSPNR